MSYMVTYNGEFNMCKKTWDSLKKQLDDFFDEVDYFDKAQVVKVRGVRSITSVMFDSEFDNLVENLRAARVKGTLTEEGEAVTDLTNYYWLDGNFGKGETIITITPPEFWREHEKF